MNKYDVLGVVGEGAYGVVLKCKNKDTNEVVAIKKFKESEEDEVVRKTTLREVKILRIMRHENIVQLREAFRRKGKLYLVFEFVEKSMLDILEANPNGVDSETVRVLTCQLARATEYCHRHDVIHRDIKPENLLINPADYALRLCDFGFARTMTADSPLTDYVATRWYRAPELLLGSTHYGKDVDIWALGCIMGELTDGQPLFAGESEVDQLFVIQKVLGPLTPEHMEMFLRNPRFLGIQFPDVSRPETLEKRYVRRMPKLQMQLLKGVLVMEPRRRLTARDVLRMPWFEGIKLPRSLRPPSQSQSRMRPDSSGSVAQHQQQQQQQQQQQAQQQQQHHQPPQQERSNTTVGTPQSRSSAAAMQQPPEPSVAQLGMRESPPVREQAPPRHEAQHAQNPWHDQVPEPSEPRGPREDPRMLREDMRSQARDEQPSLQVRNSTHDIRASNDMRGGGGGVGGHPHHRDEPVRGLRGEDPRVQQQHLVHRDDPRMMFEDPRFAREGGHGQQGPGAGGAAVMDPRMLREVDPRAAFRGAANTGAVSAGGHVGNNDDGGMPPSRGGGGGCATGMMSREDPRASGLAQQQHHHQQHQQQHQHHPSRPHPYVLPWEDSMPEEGPPPEYASSQPQGLAYGDADEKVNGDGRRSRQHRRQGADAVGGIGQQGDWCDPRLPNDRGTPSNADRGGTPFGFGVNAVGQGLGMGGGGGGGGMPSKASRSATNPSGPQMGFGNGMIGGGQVPSGGLFGAPMPVSGPGAGVGGVNGAVAHGGGVGHSTGMGHGGVHGGMGPGGQSATAHHGVAVGNGSSNFGGGGGGGGSGGIGEGVAGTGVSRHGGTSSTAVRHGVSAGTGGSEEWPSTQGKVVRQLREPEFDEDPNKTPWAQQGLPRRKAGRQPAALGGVPGPPTRRSPDLVDPWQQEQRHEAWRGDVGIQDMHGGLGGLPSIHGGFLAGPQGVGHGDGSRAPSRLTAGTPTPREEDSLDLAARQLHAVGSGRWGGGVSAGGNAGDWPGHMQGPAELGPVREVRGALHESRTPQHQHDSRAALGGMRGRHDLSAGHGGHGGHGVYHGH